jgi:Zn-dependent protease with chaperone function
MVETVPMSPPLAVGPTVAATRAIGFVELEPFYALAWLGTAVSAASLALCMALTLVDHVGSGIAALASVGAAAALVASALLFFARAQRRGSELEGTARAGESQRLAGRLAPMRARLRAFAGDAVDLRVVPAGGVNVWTERSRGTGLVFLSTAMWARYADTAELDAALAHEAGHVRARDVETFQRLLSAQRALILVGPIVALTVAVRSALSASPLALPSFVFLFVVLGACALGAASAWSALICARELSADAFAAHMLGGDGALRAYFETQIAARKAAGARTGLASRAWRWFVQPALSWRTTLPARSGVVGARIEVSLAFALATFAFAADAMAMECASFAGELPIASAVCRYLPDAVFVYTMWLGYRFVVGHMVRTGGRTRLALRRTLAFFARLALSASVWGALLVELEFGLAVGQEPPKPWFHFGMLLLGPAMATAAFGQGVLAAGFGAGRGGAARGLVAAVGAALAMAACYFVATNALLLCFSLSDLKSNLTMVLAMAFGGLVATSALAGIVGFLLVPEKRMP